MSAVHTFDLAWRPIGGFWSSHLIALSVSRSLCLCHTPRIGRPSGLALLSFPSLEASSHRIPSLLTVSLSDPILPSYTHRITASLVQDGSLCILFTSGHHHHHHPATNNTIVSRRTSKPSFSDFDIYSRPDHIVCHTATRSTTYPSIRTSTQPLPLNDVPYIELRFDTIAIRIDTARCIHQPCTCA